MPHNQVHDQDKDEARDHTPLPHAAPHFKPARIPSRSVTESPDEEVRDAILPHNDPKSLSDDAVKGLQKANEVDKSLHASQVAHQAGVYPGFPSMKRLGVFLLPPGWDASPSQGYPQH